MGYTEAVRGAKAVCDAGFELTCRKLRTIGCRLAFAAGANILRTYSITVPERPVCFSPASPTLSCGEFESCFTDKLALCRQKLKWINRGKHELLSLKCQIAAQKGGKAPFFRLTVHTESKLMGQVAV